MLTKYRQLALQTREGRPGYEIYMVLVEVGALGGGIKVPKVDLKKIFDNNELFDEVLMDSESIVRRVMSSLVQGEDNE